MTRNPSSRSHLREPITQLAARLMAEDGIDDFAFAKRKAARQLGAADTPHLPHNRESSRRYATTGLFISATSNLIGYGNYARRRCVLCGRWHLSILT